MKVKIKHTTKSDCIYIITVKNLTEARHWIINHLDIGETNNWATIPISMPEYKKLSGNKNE